MFKGRGFRSTALDNHTLRLSLEELVIDAPTGDEIVIRVDGSPLNPSDIGSMLDPADMATLRKDGDAILFDVPQERRARTAGRIGQEVPTGGEGTGIVVATGPDAKALEGKRVSVSGGGLHADYRKAKASEVTVLPDSLKNTDGAGLYVNPMTALSFVETAKLDGHKALVHTAAASNLGQMLQRICTKDGLTLINIVRSEEQAQILRDVGATHILNSRDDDFEAKLVDVLAETKATLAFDAIGGGRLGSDILLAMETAAARGQKVFNRYGSGVFKTLNIYGTLDRSPTLIDRTGYQWSVNGYLLTAFMTRVGPDYVAKMRARVAAEATTTFASHYTRIIGLTEALDPDVIRAYERKATGEKYLIDPTRN